MFAFFEPKGEFDGEVSYILADKVLQLSTNQSSRDTVKEKGKSHCRQGSSSTESDGVVELTLAKSMIAKMLKYLIQWMPVRIVEVFRAKSPFNRGRLKRN